MKKILVVILLLCIMFSFVSCGEEIELNPDIVWMTEDGSSWFIYGDYYRKAVLNGIDYTEVVEANSPNDLRFSRNRMFLVNLHYNLKGDYMKCVCDQDRNNEIAVGTEFIFYPHDINEDTPMMATWRESLDVKSDTLWMTEDGTSWFIRSETREEAVINGVAFSDIDISNFPGELYLKKDDEYALVFVYWTQTDDYVELYCRHDRDQITEKNIWRFYPHDIDE